MNGPRLKVNARPRAKAQQPNHFLSMRLKGEELEKNFRAFYGQTAERYPKLRPFLIDPATMHLTMFVMHLPNDRVERAGELLKSAKPLLDSHFQSRAPDIHLTGASTFGNRVVYATPSPLRDLEILNNLQKELQIRFRDDGINLVGNRPQWTPHCTLMKIRPAPGNAGGSIPAKSWSGYKDFVWGSASIAGIDLCSMRDEKEADGYDRCVAHVPFVSD
ncbi:kinase A anchor protein [Geranomyces variabilis]|nr:kinase A anchor protein [Geranomyces variabilis]KAJ3138134.1 A-kinase anchor protein 7 isoforms alpha and beta [Geranomyces variabilis]